jgi:Protein of unknown function (DUF3074)
MAALHSALQSLGPCKFEDLPSSPLQFEPYLQGLFKQSQLILESIPIPPPDEKPETRPRSHTTSSVASNASEISSSSARSAPPVPEWAALQKEWGKPIKLAAKDNPLNMAVYRMGGKDGRGAWFARRSVHEGLGFARFKKSLEMEFPESLAVQGAPGEGNIRGIGGDRRVEDISVPGKGRVEVFQLSAQFPGPTTPRDFVTLLITSSNAMKQNDESGRPDLSPRHYMIISKPCDHPETQPRNSYVRGSYESVEFIREVPSLPKKSVSSLDLSKLSSGKGSPLKKEAVLRNAEKREKTDSFSTNHENKSMNDLSAATKGSEGAGRRRGKTISFSDSRADELRAEDDGNDDIYHPKVNPVEWIMVTRSDPGGSVPRFMVERGTPGSIVADASKFLDWACQNQNVAEDSKGDSKVELDHRRDSYASYELNGHLAGINGESTKEVIAPEERPSIAPSAPDSLPQSINQSGILSNMTGAFSAGLEAYAPQVVLDRLPGHTPQESEATMTRISTHEAERDDDETDTDSLSTISFASADSHLDLSSDDQPSLSPSLSKSSTNQNADSNHPPKNDKEKPSSAHEKELAKLTARRAALDAKLASTRAKSQKDHQSQTAKERDAIRKVEEKHAKEMQKQEEKYRKEIEKLEQRRQREERKVEEKKRREREKEKRGKEGKEGKGDQDKEKDTGKEKHEKKKVERERDEARKEVERLKGERDVWKRQIGDLQRENTGLAARVGRLEREIKDGSSGKGSLESLSAGVEEGGGKEKSKEKERPLHPILLDKDALKHLLKEERADAGTIGNASAGAGGTASEKGSVRSIDSARSRSSTWLKRQMSGMGVGIVSGGSGGGSGNPEIERGGKGASS